VVSVVLQCASMISGSGVSATLHVAKNRTGFVIKWPQPPPVPVPLCVQVRQLFAVALATNRIVVLPKLQCYCDRYWGPLHRCRLPGANKLRLPFACPLDHIMEPFHMDDDKFGPPLEYREHSFFENGRTPDQVKNGVTLFKRCTAG
jgi:hypothetical protein